jgi:hypothetical protein
MRSDLPVCRSMAFEKDLDAYVSAARAKRLAARPLGVNPA